MIRDNANAEILNTPVPVGDCYLGRCGKRPDH